MTYFRQFNKNIKRALRLLLESIFPNMAVHILKGRLKGMKWIVSSGNPRYCLGTYEHKHQELFTKTITEGGCVYDIGAHVGFYTLLASVLVGNGGRVIAFEPLPRNIHYLKKHLQLNHCNNVTLIEAAVGGKSGNAFFRIEPSSYTGYLSTEGRFKVKLVGLDEIVLNGEIPPPDYIKMDIEGGEYLALLGAREILIKYHPTIFLSTHGIEVHQKC